MMEINLILVALVGVLDPVRALEHVGRTPCSMNDCIGPYKIGIPEVPVLKESLDRTTGMLITANFTVTGLLGRRQRYKSYCYNGGSIDGNTGCLQDFKPFPPSENELKEWGRRDQCQVGVECNKGDDDCWGSDSDKCVREVLPLGTWLKSSTMKHVHEEWMIWPHHTCIIQWECYVRKSEYQVHIEKRKNKIVMLTYGENGKELLLKKETETMVNVDKNTRLLLLTKGLDLQTEIVNVSCFIGTETKALCQLPSMPSIPSLGGTVVEIVNGVGWERNMILTVKTHPKLKGNSSKSYVLQATGSDRREKIGSHIMASASIDDLKPIMSALLFANAESNYNIVNLLKEIRELRAAQSELIKSVGKVDDELIGNIMKISSKSKWFNHDLFHLCPCYQVNLPSNKNCKAGFMFKNGRLTTQFNTSECTTYSDEVVKDLKLYHKHMHPLAVLQLPPPVGISQDWDGWSFYSAMKEKLLETSEFSDTAQSLNGPLSYIMARTLDSVRGWDLFNSMSSFVGWIALGLAVLANLRR